MNSSQNFSGSYSQCHAFKSYVNPFFKTTFLSTSQTYDGTLSPTVNKSLYWNIIDFHINIKHGYMTKKLREIFLSYFILFIDHILSNLIFNLFLSLNIKHICVIQSISLLHFFSFFFHTLTQTFSYYFLQFYIIVSCYCFSKFPVLM